MNVLDLYRSKGLDAKKVGSTHGGEWAGPCPGCGGEDRFRVWPEQNDGTGSFWCRGCGKSGDRVTFLMEFDGKSYPQACAALDIEMMEQAYRTPVVPGKKKKERRSEDKKFSRDERQAGKPLPQDSHPGLWMEQAEKLVSWANGKLLENQEQMAWLAARGIDGAAVETHRLGWNPGKDDRDLWRPRESWGLATEMKKNKSGSMVKKRLWIPRGLVIPFPPEAPARIRIRRPEQTEPRYYVLPGSDMGMMLIREPGVTCRVSGDTGDRAVLVIESELDAIMCHALGHGMCSVMALGSSSAKPDDNVMEILRKAAVVLLALDFDQAGKKAMKWWAQFLNLKLWPAPWGKDPGEAYAAGTDIREWIATGLPSAWGVGQSPLDNKKQIAKSIADISENSGVARLAELLKKHPVVIHNMPDRTYVAAPMVWQAQNWEVYKEISNLVFLDSEVFRYVCSHPETKITGDNITG